METKICSKCKRKLPASKKYFHAQKAGKYGLRSICKKCCKIDRKIYTSTPKYKESHRKQMSKWRKANPEKALEVSRKNYKINGKEHNAKRKLRYATDLEFKQKCIEREKKYVDSGRRHEMNIKPETKEKAILRSRKRRLIPEKKQHDYKRQAEWRDENREKLIEHHRNRRKELVPAYIAQSMRISVEDLTPEILETRQLIIKIKRELKNNNIKIK